MVSFYISVGCFQFTWIIYSISSNFVYLFSSDLPRDFLGWAVLLNFLVYITIPVVLQYTGILLGVGSFAIYVNTIIGLAKKENYFWEQVNKRKPTLKYFFIFSFLNEKENWLEGQSWFWLSSKVFLDATIAGENMAKAYLVRRGWIFLWSHRAVYCWNFFQLKAF